MVREIDYEILGDPEKGTIELLILLFGDTRIIKKLRIRLNREEVEYVQKIFNIVLPKMVMPSDSEKFQGKILDSEN